MEQNNNNTNIVAAQVNRQTMQLHRSVRTYYYEINKMAVAAEHDITNKRDLKSHIAAMWRQLKPAEKNHWKRVHIRHMHRSASKFNRWAQKMLHARRELAEGELALSLVENEIKSQRKSEEDVVRALIESAIESHQAWEYEVARSLVQEEIERQHRPRPSLALVIF